MSKQTTVGQYLISRLEEINLKHIFGIPGDYVLKFFSQLADSNLNIIGTSSEQGAAFAADAYARVNGLGAICITYCVGGLNVINAVAGAYAEKSPLIVISGAPGLNERAHSHLLHHCVKDFDTQYKIFSEVTVASAQINDAHSAPELIDSMIKTCIRYKRPVYIELPRDLVDEPCEAPKRALDFEREKSDPQVLEEAIQEAALMLRSAKKPAILGCIEIHRLGLQDLFLELLDVTGFPFVSTLTGKSVISEEHPQYVGVYMGAVGKEESRITVEESDGLLMLGAFMTDLNMGTAHFNVAHTINATSEDISIKYHHYKGIELKDFMQGLINELKRYPKRTVRLSGKTSKPALDAEPSGTLTAKYFYKRIDSFIKEKFVVISDVGDCLFASSDLTIPEGSVFVSPAYYTSMGFGVPAAIGIQINNPENRAVVLTGDGAFQMTGQEVSTLARLGLNSIIFVVNNSGYMTQRFIKDGYFNDIQDWAYHKLPELFNKGLGIEVRTEGELEEALIKAKNNTDSFTIINVHVEKKDASEALLRVCKYISGKAGTKAKV